MKQHSFILIVFISFFNSHLFAQSCGTPDVLLFGTNQTSSTVTPYWVAIPGATYYNVRYRIRNGGFDYSPPLSTTTASVSLTGLLPLTNYEFIVQSVCGTDTSIYSASGWFTTLNGSVSESITRGPYMTVASMSSVTIQWSTDIPVSSEVTYGTTLNNLAYKVNSNVSSNTHVIMLNNLQPNTKYFYSVGKIDTMLEGTANNFFFTAPADNDTTPMRFWVTGDFGTGFPQQLAVRDAFANYTSGQKINGWLWLGDNAYTNGTDQEYQNNVFDIYPDQFKNIPVFPALGNHDYAQSGYLSQAALGTNFPYFSIFSIPTNSGTEKYYSANYGSVHFIALDSYGSYNNTSSNMYQWLQADLAANTQQWTIVYFHHPPYTKGSHDSDVETELLDMRHNIVPLLESYGVDLVLCGHSHCYERSFLIKGHYGLESSFNPSYMVEPGGGPYSKTSRTGNGTTYVVCGSSGQVSATTAGWPHNAMYYSTASIFGSLLLDVTGTSLNCSFLTSTGTIADSFSMSKPAIPSTTAVNEINKNNSAGFQVYPNPVKNDFNIFINAMNNADYYVRICNTLGQTLFNKHIDAGENNNGIKISKKEIGNYPPGIYYISVQNGKNIVTKQLIFGAE